MSLRSVSSDTWRGARSIRNASDSTGAPCGRGPQNRSQLRFPVHRSRGEPRTSSARTFAGRFPSDRARPWDSSSHARAKGGGPPGAGRAAEHSRRSGGGWTGGCTRRSRPGTVRPATGAQRERARQARASRCGSGARPGPTPRGRSGAPRDSNDAGATGPVRCSAMRTYVRDTRHCYRRAIGRYPGLAGLALQRGLSPVRLESAGPDVPAAARRYGESRTFAAGRSVAQLNRSVALANQS
jgi:hypothetical protein